jgi:hypothetical protein
MRPAILLSGMLLAACSTGSDGDSLRSVPLADTGLAGNYDLVDYLFVYGDGFRLDPSVLEVTGTLYIGADSAYREGIRIGNDSTPTSGKITSVRVGSSVDQGDLLLTLDGSAVVGVTGFSFRHDTLVLVTEVSKERDSEKKGFRETAYYARQRLDPD